MADFRNLMLHTAPMEAPASTTYVAPFQMPTPEEFARREAKKKKEALLQDYEQNYVRHYDNYIRANRGNLSDVPLRKLPIDDWVKLKNNVVDAAINMRTVFLTPDMRAQIQQTPPKEASVAEDAGALLGRASDNLTSGVRDWIHSVTGVGYSQKEQGVERANRVQENIDLEKKSSQIRADIEAGNEVSDEDYELLQEHDAPFMQQLIRGIKDTPEFVQELATNPEARDMFADESIRQLPANIGFMAAIKSPLASVGNQLKVLSRIAKLRRANKKVADAVRESRFKELAKDAAAATVAGAVTEYAHGLGEQIQESPGYTAGQGIVLDGLVPLAVSQIGKGMGRRIAGDGNKSGTEAESAQTETDEDPRFSLIGERGAVALDQSEGSTARMDNLAKAEEMEASEKNPTQIWHATGWERGADSKWRYEIPDLTLNYRFSKLKEGDGAGGDFLEKIVTDDQGLFKAYPDMKKTIVSFQDLGDKGDSGYTSKTADGHPLIVLNNKRSEAQVQKTLHHEIQHLIQEKEGFARGGSPKEWADKHKEIKLELENLYPKIDAAWANQDLDSYHKLVEERDALVPKLLELQDEYGIPGYKQYRSLAGESEARNVAFRNKMPQEIRNNNPPSETEDVPRNEQIVRFHAASEAGISESHDTPEAREAARKAWREKGTDSPFFQRWFGDSKVVDDQGKPLVVYHGARTTDNFTKFNDGKIFFTDNREVAEMFNDNYKYKLIVDGEEHALSSFEARAIKDMIEPYEDLELITDNWNLLDSGKTIDDFNELIGNGGIQVGINSFDGVKDIRVVDNSNVYEVYLDIKNPKIIDMKDKEWDFEIEKFDWTFGDHDGIIVKNVIEGGPTAELSEGREVPPATNYIVKNSSQIKSATDNAGTFDGSNPDIRYMALNPDFAKELDAWDGNERITFNVGSTSEPLKNIGVKDKGIIWYSGKINEILNKHKGMTKDIIKQVPNILENPIVVLKSKQKDKNTANSRLVIFGEVHDKNGNPVTAVLDLLPTGDKLMPLDFNLITSAYGKDTNPAGFISKSDVLYITEDKDKADAWFHGVGLQLPKVKTKLGSIGNIEYSKDGIDIKGVPFSQLSEDTSALTEKPQISTQQTTPKPIPKADLDKIVNNLNKNGLAVEVITDKDKFEGAISKQFATPDGTIYGYATTDGRIGLNPAKMNANTPMHEYGHLWIDFVKQNNKGLYNDIARLAIQTDEFQQLMQNPAYNNLTDQQRAEEAIATIIGNKGEAAFHNAPKGLQAKLKQLIAELWQWIKEQFGHSSNIRSLTPEQVQNMTFDELMGKAAEDISAGKRIANDTPSNELDFNLWRHTMTDQEEPTGGEQVDNAAPANAESQTPETKVDDDALFSDDPDKVREQLKNVSHDKPLTRQEKKEEKLKEKLGPDYAPPADRILKKELGLTSADIKKLQEESHKHKEASEDEKASEADRAVSKLRSEQAEEKAEAAYKEFISGIEQEFGEAQKVDPAFKEQATFYAPEFNKLKHTHELQRAIMDRPDRVAVMKAIYTVLDYTDEKTDVNNWEAFKMLPPEKQLEQLNGILSAIDNTASRRVKKAAPQVPANIPQPGSGMPSTGSGKYNFDDTDDTWEWLAAQKKRGLA